MSVHTLARYYEPTSGRFVSADPMGQAASPSLYDYAHGDPVNFLDPTGRIFGTPLTLSEYVSSIGSGFHEGIMVISDTLNPTQLVGRQYAGLYADNGSYNPNAPEAQLSRDVVIATGVAVATAPAAVAGGSIIAGGLATGEIGTGVAITLGAGSTGTLGALGNVATQIIQNNGNLNVPINIRQEATAFVVGGVLGGVSGGLASGVESLNANSAELVMQLQNQASINQAAMIANGYSPALADATTTFVNQPMINLIQNTTNFFNAADFGFDNFASPVLDFLIERDIDRAFSPNDLGYVPGASPCPPPVQHN